MATPVPMPKGIAGVTAMPNAREMLVNMFATEQGLQRTPGLDAVASAPNGQCRGGATWYLDGNVYFVIGSTLYQMNRGLVLAELGTIAGSDPVVFSSGQTSLAIIVQGGKGFTYSADGGLVEITDPDFVASSSVDFIDGRHVFVPSDGSPLFFSDVDSSGSINPLSFFDAEELPDINKACINSGNQLYVLGAQATEIYRPSGDSSAPFMRREGGRVDVGFVAGLTRYKNTFAFIGVRRDQGYTICTMASGDVVDLSNPAIVEILNSYTLADLESATVESFEWNKTAFLAWTIRNITIAFADGNWVYLDSSLNAGGGGSWRARGVVFAFGRYYCGDRNTGTVGTISQSPDEYGNHIEWKLRTFGRVPRNTYASVRSLQLDALTGQGASSIGLSVSRDARSWSAFHYRDLGEIGEYQRLVAWSGGLGRYESFMGIELRGTGAVQFSLEAMQLEV